MTPEPTRASRPRAPIGTRLAVYTIAISSIGVGIGLMVRAKWGVAPNDVLNTGVSKRTGMSVGVASWVTGAVAMAISTVLRRPPRIATVLGGVIVGLSINASLAVLPSHPATAWRVLFLAGGLVVIWCGIAGVVAADVGAGPIELVMLGIMDRGVSVRVTRWGIEATLFLIGLVLGGQAGLGTFLFAFGTGPVLGLVLPWGAARLGTSLTHPADLTASGF